MNKSYVRFFNADCLGREISFFNNGKEVAKNLPFSSFTSYMEVDCDVTDFSVSCLNCTVGDAGKISLNFPPGSVYTVAALCIGDEVCLYGIREMFDKIDSSFGNLRVCNLSPDIYNADVYANKYKILGDIDYLGISKYMCIIPDTYDFSIKEAKGDKTILNCGHQRLEKGGFNTIYLIGRINSNPSLRCVFSIDAMTYNGKDL